MIEKKLNSEMWVTSTPTVEAGSAFDVFDPAVGASARDLGKNWKRPMQHGVEMNRNRKTEVDFLPFCVLYLCFYTW